MYSISTKRSSTLFQAPENRKKVKFTGIALSCWLVVLCLSSAVQAELSSYIHQYHKSTVSRQQLQTIGKYNHLIDYFSDFSYVVPKHKVSADFIRALILAESNGNPSAVSSKNALGLGQILLPTAQQAAKKLAGSSVHFRYIDKTRLANLQQTDLFDPAINILITCYLIARYNHKFDGKIELVLSAWNAGEYTPSLSEMQHAPYKETENLIGKVNGYYLYFLRQGYY